MNKLLAALIATLFAVGAFAADAPAKKEDKAAAASPVKVEKKADKAEKKADKPASKASK